MVPSLKTPPTIPAGHRLATWFKGRPWVGFQEGSITKRFTASHPFLRLEKELKTHPVHRAETSELTELQNARGCAGRRPRGAGAAGVTVLNKANPREEMSTHHEINYRLLKK